MKKSLLSVGTVCVTLVLACSTQQRIPAGAIMADTPLIRYNFKVGELTSLCKKSIERTTKRLDDVVKKETTNPLLTLEGILADFSEETTPLTFMGYVSPIDGLRAEASKCEEDVGQFYVSIFTRRDLYDAIKQSKVKGKTEERLLAETLRVFEQNGLKLSEDTLKKVKALKQKLSTIETKFAANLNNDKSTVEFTLSDLEGVPAEFLSRLKKTENKNYLVTTKTTDYLQVMQNAKISLTRKRMMFAYTNRAAEENTALLEEAILLRQKVTKLMGYKTWADYRVVGRMANSSTKINSFLNSLTDKLKLRAGEDLDKLRQFKKSEFKDDTPLEAWDLAYLEYQLKKRDYNLDDEKIREYFPAATVMAGLFEVYSKLLSVEFKEIEQGRVWATNVKLYQIVDKKSGDLLAYFYTDNVPREGKYGHAAAFTLRQGRGPASDYNIPVSAMVANFNPPTNGKPSLLNHDEVETLFHEFGHIMHQTLTRAPYASISGTSVPQDFVEAPSEMFENWVWDEKMLSQFSGHYKDSSKKLPPELLEQLIAAKDFNQGYFYTRQLTLGLFDFLVHTKTGKIDVTKTYDDLFEKMLNVKPLPGGHFAAGFGHLMGGYDAGYYGYLWSEVYAEDMFSEFKKKGLLSASLGLKYRKTILEKGNMVDPLELVKEFLGREPSQEAFYKKLGIKSEESETQKIGRH